MTSIDEQFIEFIVKSLVGQPDDVVIDRTIDEKGVLLELTVNPEDLGRVIGKRGATAQSMRTLLRALGTKNDARYNLKIVDNGVEGGGSSKPAATRDDEDGSSEESAPAEPEAEEEVVEEEAPQTEEADDEFDYGDEDDDDDDDEADEEESLADKTRRELSDLDDLDI